MDIALTHRLSFKQASLTVLMASILEAPLSLIQVGIDYVSQDVPINREVRALLDVSHDPAARTAYSIDTELAQELVLGLLRSFAVIRAEVTDTSGLPLASASCEPAEGRLRPLSDFLFGHKRVCEDPLHVDHAPGEALGVLQLEIDTFVFGNDFLRRADITLFSGSVRSLLLSLILLVLFYTLLAKSPVSLIQALSGHDPRSPAHMRLPRPRGHECDKIGVLMEVINRQLGYISVETEQRREAENRPTQYLEEPKSIAAARTTELKAANARLTLSNQELEEARQAALDMVQVRASFLANTSHEVRTPLNGLFGMLLLSLDGPLTPEQHQQLSTAHGSGKVLVELPNDVLDFPKFEAGQLVLEQVPFDLGVLVEDAASLLSQNAVAGVELTCLVDPALPAQVSGDPTRIRQVVSNLLSNALKFIRLGRADVRAEATAEGVRISVCDIGIGIAQEALDRIFQLFTQADAGITRQYGSTGLGLALMRKLCEATQGELTVESTVGLGSLFSVGLPLTPVSPLLQALPLRGRVVAQYSANSGLAQLLQTWLPHWGLEYKRLETDDSPLGHPFDVLISDCPGRPMGLRLSIGTPTLLVTAYGSFLESELARRLLPLRQLARPLSRDQLYQALKHVLEHTAIAPSSASDTAGEQRNTRALLVGGNPVSQLVAKGLLHKLSYQVWIAGHRLNVLKMLEEHPISLVLMDCNMPVMDGYEATRQIRDSGRWGSLPIIVLIANALPDEHERCRTVDMDDYLAESSHRGRLKAILDC